MVIARFLLQGKRSYGFYFKFSAVAVLSLCFILIWAVFSSSSSISSQRSSFGQIAEPTSLVESGFVIQNNETELGRPNQTHDQHSEVKFDSHSVVEDKKKINGSVHGIDKSVKKGDGLLRLPKMDTEINFHMKESKGGKKDDGKVEVDDNGDASDHEKSTEDDVGDLETLEKLEDEISAKTKERKKYVPLFNPKAYYTWRLCTTRSKHNFIPCIDIESSGKLQSYRHRERVCPRTPPMCLVPLPRGGYLPPIRWPDSKLKILYKNVEHPKLASFIKAHSWVKVSGEYLTFPQSQSSTFSHYLESIEEMAPDIEWGKNIRVVLNIGCTDANFEASLLDKDVLTLSLGLPNDLADLAQVVLERGFPAFLSPFQTKRLPFPSGVFDAIHCGRCNINWHSNGGKLLIEMNRILRPRGYFILSTKNDNFENEEAMAALTTSICWNLLGHKTEETSEMGVKIYRKPESNNIYEWRRKKIPPLCNELDNPDTAWNVALKSCLDLIPAAIEERGTEWPEDWPERLETFPDWLQEKDSVISDTTYWKAVVNRSYFIGMGINWSTIRNVMDMKANYGGFAASLWEQNVWVMNVVPVHAPDTLGIIYERGFFGVYHDWCESFGTYPRSYDLLHADHLFGPLKNRCKVPATIVVEMDRILRPGGWAIIRDKVEIVDALEKILRSLHWEIRMTYARDKEGIVCAQRNMWRP